MANSKAILKQRCAGVLLAINALPGPEDHGDFSQAFKFIEFLHEVGFGVWQVLPLGPTHDNDCPYQTLSAHAGNPYLISLDSLANEGLLNKSDLLRGLNKPIRKMLLHEAFKRFQASPDSQIGFPEFIASHVSWLPDFALFSALRDQNKGAHWVDWELSIRDRSASAIDAAKNELKLEIQQVYFEQFIFDRQWQTLRAFARTKGIQLLGDMPLFVAHDSADVWTNRSDFQLEADGHSRMVAGVPPDYFSEDGQRWDNPLFAWNYQKEQGFHWWLKRFQSELKRYDLLRIDHFRGLIASWAIPAGASSTREGEWQPVPGEELLSVIHDSLQLSDQALPLIAEDLGFITEEVNQLRDLYRIPGMRVLQFAFDGGGDNPHRLKNHIENCVLYTGTHDNNTSVGWFESLDDPQRERVQKLIEEDVVTVSGEIDKTHSLLSKNSKHVAVMPWPLIECALGSPAKFAIVPMQDLLELGAEHRTNIPGTATGNWHWRFKWLQVGEDLIPTLQGLLKKYRRLIP